MNLTAFEFNDFGIYAQFARSARLRIRQSSEVNHMRELAGTRVRVLSNGSGYEGPIVSNLRYR
jgi:hypothetical protein